MAKLALIYMSREGQTQKISERIARTLTLLGNTVTSYSLTELSEPFAFSSFDGNHSGMLHSFMENTNSPFENLFRKTQQR